MDIFFTSSDPCLGSKQKRKYPGKLLSVDEIVPPCNAQTRCGIFCRDHDNGLDRRGREWPNDAGTVNRR